MKFILSNIFKLSILIESAIFIMGVLAFWLLGGHAGSGIFITVQFPGSYFALLIVNLIPIINKSDIWYIPYVIITFVLQLVLLIIVVHYFIKLRNYFAK